MESQCTVKRGVKHCRHFNNKKVRFCHFCKSANKLKRKPRQ